MSEVFERFIISSNKSADERATANPITQQLFSSACAELGIILRGKAFKGSRASFYRDFANLTQIVNIKKARKYNNAFEFYLGVNIGIWSPRVSDPYQQSKPPRSGSSCQVRQSVVPRMEIPNHGLGWYVCDERTLEIALHEITTALIDHRLPQLERARTLEGLLDLWLEGTLTPEYKQHELILELGSLLSGFSASSPKVVSPL